MSVEALKAAIRDVPDFPVPGIIFKDITPVLSSPELFRKSLDLFAARPAIQQADRIAGIESRGFIFAAALADRLGKAFIPVRKKGKLPWKTIEKSYDLEYGSATLEMHEDAVEPGERVVVIDDLLATGGTAAATIAMLQEADAEVTEVAFLIELTFLNGRAKLEGTPVFAPIVYGFTAESVG